MLAQKEPKEPKIIKLVNQIPEEILMNPLLNKAISFLPKGYNFEVHKSVWRIQQLQLELKKKQILISLQFPEGLMLFACLISDIFRNFTGCDTVITGDVTYGACCIDDLTAQSLGADFIVHYGHSCLIPISDTVVKTLYVFVEMNIDIKHMVETMSINFQDLKQTYYLMGTIQFNTFLYNTKKQLNDLGYENITIPQERPRSQGEILGCTSPILTVNESSKNIIIFICDGRFHMESAMIQNPQFEFFQYNPYSQEFTIEQYDHKQMMGFRVNMIKQCQQMDLRMVCIILGTLGRQGSPHILKRIQLLLKSKNIEYVVLLVSEINFEQLSLVEDVDCFVQIACPRLSIDWGPNFDRPLITPYELFVVLGLTDWKTVYPMDYYSNNGGPWTNYYHKQNDKKCKNKIQLKYENA